MALASTLYLACVQPYCVSAQASGIPNSTPTLGAAVANATNTGLLLIGALAVIFMIVGGLQYVLSGGNSQRTKQARETLLYAAVGLVIAGAAYAIVVYLSGQLGF
jgi:hypothetical protein